MPKRTPLVCQHLENVSRDVLEQHQDIVRQYVRHCQGAFARFRFWATADGMEFHQ